MKTGSTIFQILACATVLAMGSGCASVGHDFDAGKVHAITQGVTTERDVEAMFGKPWRTGIENGVVTWTYGRYTYRVFGETDTKDLVLKFDKAGRVTSYTFNTTEEQ